MDSKNEFVSDRQYKCNLKFHSRIIPEN